MIGGLVISFGFNGFPHMFERTVATLKGFRAWMFPSFHENLAHFLAHFFTAFFFLGVSVVTHGG